MLMGDTARRRLKVINMGNSGLLGQYLVEMKLKMRNKRNPRSEDVYLKRFQDYLAKRLPTKLFAKRFIADFIEAM
jgi:hypothetical protein